MLHCSWDVIDVIIFHFGSFFALLRPLTAPKIKIYKKMKKPPRDIIWPKSTKNYDHMMYSSWDMAHDRCNCYSHFELFFALLPPNSPKKQNFAKIKKPPEDIMILHMCNKYYDQMMYSSWDMLSDGCNFFFILGHFLPFYPPNSPKNQN